ncbi:NAD-dependent epimerase/dehydratase family protein [Nocardia sp. SSK8]|uniref:NAD-dependent epimerase/dehydratase family protein n=1 Tax=Nocardia sp. SSK8 TaxID=3120154 RepID=UPI003008F294
MSVLVLGGYGAVGAHLVRLLRAAGIRALAAGRDPVRADRVVDLASASSLGAALSDVSIVVNCAGVEDIRLVEECVRRDIVFVDISATSGYVQDLERVDGPVVLGVGLAPGMTSALAVAALTDDPGPVDIMIGLGAGEHHGPAATAWTYQLLGQRFPDPDGSDLRNFTRPTHFAVPGAAGYRRFPAVRADFADQHRLTHQFSVPVRSYLRLDSRLATLGLASLTWIPPLRALTPKHLPGTDTWVVLARTADGTTRWATGHGQSLATAAVAAITVEELASHRITTPTWLHDILHLDQLLHRLPATGVEITAGRTDGRT